ncbi:MAG: hypothetical protein LUG18_14685 [Candidatus Azobacteroides sp.]|nr:hypothetical protein [Candidatus Azobacteroides sp.]
MIPNNTYYRDLKDLDALKSEKKLLKKKIKRQEEVLQENWLEIKKPFRLANVALSVASFAIPTKKAKWLPMFLSGVQFATSLMKKRK